MIQGRPEKQTDPDKLPGQLVYRPPQAVYLRDVIARIEAVEASPCRCNNPAEPCEGCPYATVNS